MFKFGNHSQHASHPTKMAQKCNWNSRFSVTVHKSVFQKSIAQLQPVQSDRNKITSTCKSISHSITKKTIALDTNSKKRKRDSNKISSSGKRSLNQSLRLAWQYIFICTKKMWKKQRHEKKIYCNLEITKREPNNAVENHVVRIFKFIGLTQFNCK